MRTIVWFIYFFVSLFCLLPANLKAERLKSQHPAYYRPFVEKKIGNWAQTMLRLAGVSVIVEGKENIPDEPVVFVSNHQGNFDIPILLTSLDRPHPLVAKKELLKLPFVPSWMRHLGCVFMDRDNPRQAVSALNEAIERVRNQSSMIIFPEGTRSKGDMPGEFKSGAFRIAQKTGAKLVPIAINGSYRVMEQNGGWIRPNTVKITILPPIDMQTLSKDDQKEIGNTVRESILQILCVDKIL